MQGYIKLYRQVLHTEIFGKEKATKRQAWYELLLLTNHKSGYINIKNGQQIKVCAGQCGYSKLALADIWGWSKEKVTRFLNVLEREKMIQQKKVYNHTVITILNWEVYQNNTTNKTTNEQQTIQQTGTNNNDNNDKNDKNDKKSLSCETKKNEITEEEREKLIKYYEKKGGIENPRGYVDSIIKNGDSIKVLEDIKQKEKQVQKKAEQTTTYKPSWKQDWFNVCSLEEYERIKQSIKFPKRNKIV